MANSEILSKLIKEVQEESTPVVKFANQLVEEYVRDLDEAMRELDTIMVSIRKLNRSKPFLHGNLLSALSVVNVPNTIRCM